MSTTETITKPLNTIKHMLKGNLAVFSRSTSAIRLKAKRPVQFVVSAGIAFLFKYPTLRNRVQLLISRMPWLRQRLLRIAVNSGVTGNSHLPASLRGYQPSPPELVAMTPRARQIYQELKSADKKCGGV